MVKIMTIMKMMIMGKAKESKQVYNKICISCWSRHDCGSDSDQQLYMQLWAQMLDFAQSSDVYRQPRHSIRVSSFHYYTLFSVTFPCIKVLLSATSCHTIWRLVYRDDRYRF